ncbi:MAG: glycosyltransferase family 2 protein [Candidatus Melainabacteria bacterium]|nr:glycosyltransferase family 2 protein [Candidatus Melainabacteria bacterium]
MDIKEEKISLIIPCFNERHAIEKTIEEANFLLGKILYEIIVVDDGSFDGTSELLKDRKDIKYIKNPYNKGYGYSIKKGIYAAAGNVIAITDADGTYPIESILLMMKKLEDGYDMVIGKRENLKSFDPFIKKLSRLCFKTLAEFVAGEKIQDVNSGLRVFRRDVISKYLLNTSSGFSFSLSTTLIFILEGLSVYYYPIEYKQRVGKSKVKYLRDILRSAQILVETISLYNPIKIFMLMAFKVSILGFIVLLLSIFSSLLTVAQGIITFSILQGLAIFIFSFGLLGSLLKKRVLSNVTDSNK